MLPSDLSILRSGLCSYCYITSFKCASMVLFDVADPMTMEPYAPTFSIYELPHWVDPQHRSLWMMNHGAYGGQPGTSTANKLGYSLYCLFTPPDTPFAAVWKPSNERYAHGVLVNASREAMLGKGYRIGAGEQLMVPMTILRVAEDFHWLSEERFNMMRLSEPNLEESEVYRWHLQVESLLDEAEEALTRLEYSKAYSKA